MAYPLIDCLRPSLSIAIFIWSLFQLSKWEFFLFTSPIHHLTCFYWYKSQYLILVSTFFVSIEMIGCFYSHSRRNLETIFMMSDEHFEVLTRYDKKIWWRRIIIVHRPYQIRDLPDLLFDSAEFWFFTDLKTRKSKWLTNRVSTKIPMLVMEMGIGWNSDG